MYQDLTMRNGWRIKKSIVNLPIRMKGNLKCVASNFLSPMGSQNKDLGAVSQMLLLVVKLRL